MTKKPVRLKQAEHTRNIWTSTPDPGTTLDDLLKPEFWTHISRKLNISDRIEVTPEDGSFFAELYVADVGVNNVKVKLLRKVDFDEPATVQDDDDESAYYVKWRGNNRRFCVIRKTDDIVMKENIQTKAQAKEEQLRLDIGEIN